MSKTLRTRLLEHAGALVLVLAIAVVIGWSLAESHQGVLEATGISPRTAEAQLQPIVPTPTVRKVADVSKPQ